VPYANLSDPQTLNLYSYVSNNPLGRADADGHCCEWLQNAWSTARDTGADFINGVSRGAAASVSMGTAPGAGPSPSDSGVNRLGQGVGAGVVMFLGAKATEGGVALAVGGSETAVAVPAGIGIATLGAAAQVGAAKELGAVISAPMQSSGFSSRTKQEAKAAAGGKCQNCGVETTPGQKSQKGVTPPGNEGQTDHIVPKSKGGTNDPSNAQHLCRDCNINKSDKMPNQP